MPGFQVSVNVQPAIGIAGDFASANPRSSVQAGAGGLVAGPQGVTVGAFAWVTYATADDANAPGTVQSFYGVQAGLLPTSGGNAPDGFVHREMQALNTIYPPYTTTAGDNTIQPGLGVGGLFRSGDFFMTNSGTTPVQPGHTVYAYLATGLARGGYANTSGTVATTAIAAATAISCTATVNGNIMTVSAISTGTIVAGALMANASLIVGTMVTGQITPLLTGEALGGIGRYTLSIPEQTLAVAGTVTGSYGVLTLGATPTTAVPIGALLSSSTIVGTATFVTQLLSGSPGVSGATFAVSNATVAGSATVTFTLDVATNWVVDSSALAGEVFKARSLIP